MSCPALHANAFIVIPVHRRQNYSLLGADAPRSRHEVPNGNHSEVDALKANCPTRQVIARIAHKWTMLVITALEGDEAVRFSELRRRIEGVSQKMLTQTLRALERDGLVTRTVYPTVPVTVEYRLTALGRV